MSEVEELSDRGEGAQKYLWRALQAPTPGSRARYAQAGLATDHELETDTHFLLLRQLYLAHMELGELESGLEIARQMVAVGTLPDVARHDAARTLIALNRSQEAIGEQRLAARVAPSERRSFHLWNLATMQHFAGEPELALSTLLRAERFSKRDRPLLLAHAAYIELDTGLAPEGLREIREELNRAKCREGYGQFLLGMIAYLIGDLRGAAPHLRSFLRRNASADAVKVLTLREELSRARRALAVIESE